MKQNLTKFFNLIKKDKQARTLTIIGVLLLFIFTIGYSLSMFTSSKNTTLANIKVNDLSFNITTNSGTSDDRVLHLQAGKTESFNIVITNLNKINAKYELIYDVCSDSNCTSILDSLSNNVNIEFIANNSDELSGVINNNNETKEINLLTTNNTDNDVYIRLNLNAGYVWNELELANQIGKYSNATDIIAYVDGVEVNNYPSACNYVVTLKGYIGDKEVEIKNPKVTCDFVTKEWTTSYGGYASKIVLYFVKGLVPGTFADDSWTKISEVIKNGQAAAYNVGDEREVEINGFNYTVRVANNSTPEECSQSGFSQTACGFVVEFVDIPLIRQANNKQSNVGGWPSLPLRTYINETFYTSLSEDLQNVIIDTMVVSGHGSGDSNPNRTDRNWESIDKLYLLSPHEIWSDRTNYVYDYYQTRQLDYYANNNVTDSNYSLAKKYELNSTSSTYWWLRTAYGQYSVTFFAVNTTGRFMSMYANAIDSDNGNVYRRVGVAPAFRIG